MLGIVRQDETGVQNILRLLIHFSQIRGVIAVTGFEFRGAVILQLAHIGPETFRPPSQQPLLCMNHGNSFRHAGCEGYSVQMRPSRVLPLGALPIRFGRILGTNDNHICNASILKVYIWRPEGDLGPKAQCRVVSIGAARHPDMQSYRFRSDGLPALADELMSE